MDTLKILIWTLTVLLLAGCSAGSGPLSGSISGNKAGLGTYTYEVTAQSISVDVRSLRGGPLVEVRTEPDGTRFVTITPSNQKIVGEVLQLIR